LEDGETMYAHYALHRLRIRFKDFAEMDDKEKALTIASIKLKVEEEKKK
jgi:hypothetical protein